ncbi:unnamed protein product [Pedinophyceae sp. YPF-701]|nr:unnamed protein product [Pedinophyceae sp. YPF-701]
MPQGGCHAAVQVWSSDGAVRGAGLRVRNRWSPRAAGSGARRPLLAHAASVGERVARLTPELKCHRTSPRSSHRTRATKEKAGSEKPRSDVGGVEASWFFTESGVKGFVQALELDDMTDDLPEILAEMGVEYSPERLREAFQRRPLEVNARAVRVAGMLGRWGTSVLSDVATGKVEEHMRKRARQLVSTLAALGPSFIKIGQALSARPDLLPKVYLEELSALQDQLPPFPTVIARQVIREELGADAEELFAEFSPTPVAAASLGQVYKGRLFDGSEVAIKVQRPGIGESIAIDMILLRRLLQFVDRTVPQAGGQLVPLIDEFAGRLFAEMDYNMEGRNCEAFERLYCGDAKAKVAVPKIYWEQTARRVLTMEWIDGVKLTDKAAMDRAGLDIIDFVDIGIECTLRQLLEHGFFHADPHPGNLLATERGTLVYLDFGMMSEAPQSARYALIAHVVHLVNKQYYEMTQDYYALDFIDESVDTRPIAPALAEFFDDVLTDSVSTLNFRSIVDGLGEVLFAFPFKVPAYYALILRSLTVLEGLALQADEDYKLLARAYPYMARRLLTDPAPQLRSSLEELLLKDGEFRWSRLEGLLKEGSKSYDFDVDGLWQLAEWVFNSKESKLRKPLSKEIVQITDAAIADAWRQQASSAYGSSTAEKLLPYQVSEKEHLKRARLLSEALSEYGVGASMHGSGPMGMPTPQDIAAFVGRFQTEVPKVAPRVGKVMSQPGAVEFFNDVSTGLASRGTARLIKLAFSADVQNMVPRTFAEGVAQQRAMWEEPQAPGGGAWTSTAAPRSGNMGGGASPCTFCPFGVRGDAGPQRRGAPDDATAPQEPQGPDPMKLMAQNLSGIAAGFTALAAAFDAASNPTEWES